MLILQAGSSGPGIALAAAYAEAVFTAQRTLEDGQKFYRELKQATSEYGRNPDHIKVLPGIVPIIGGTEEEAQAKERRLDDLLVHTHALQQLANDVGIPADQIDLDAPLPKDIRSPEEIEGNRTRYELTVEFARRDNLTVRQVLAKLAGGRGHRTLAGTPEQIADSMHTWFVNGAADGFNVMPAAMPSGLEDFVDHVIPVLRKRGLFRYDYGGSTLREHYGLPVPARVGRHAAALGAAS